MHIVSSSSYIRTALECQAGCRGTRYNAQHSIIWQGRQVARNLSILFFNDIVFRVSSRAVGANRVPCCFEQELDSFAGGANSAIPVAIQTALFLYCRCR